MSSHIEDVAVDDPRSLLSEDRAVNGGVVRVLTLNRPARRNALDTALLQQLDLALQSADRDGQVAAVVLAGRGPIFCAGGDLKEFAGLNDARDRMIVRARMMSRLLSSLPAMSTPVVAAVTGAALGAGAALALAADLIVAGDDLTLGYPEITDSVVPAVVMAGAVRQFGQKLAFQMLTQGRRLGAEAALTRDVVMCVVPPDEAVEVAVQTAAVWARVDPQAVSQTKHLFYRVAEMTVDAGIVAGLDVTAATWSPRR